MTRERVATTIRLRRATAAAILAPAVVLVTWASAVTSASAATRASGAPAGAAGCGPAPQGRTAVVVVIDRGDQGGVGTHCVEVATGATGMEALFAAVGQGAVRRDDPVKGPAFVCGIGGVPATGCAAVGEPYWSYWGGDGGGWTYRSVGAFGTRLRGRCAVEGWRFGTGQAPPRVGVPAITCEAPPQPAPTPTQPAPGPAGTARAVVGGATTLPSGGGPAAAGADGTQQPAAPGDQAAAPSATPDGGAPTDPSAPDPGSDPGPGDQEETVTTEPGAGEDTADKGDRGSGEERAEAQPVAATAAADGGGPGVGALVALVAVLVLGVAAFVRARRGGGPAPAAVAAGGSVTADAERSDGQQEEGPA